jgi:hypothetical protein
LGFVQPIIDIANYNQPIIGTGKECQSIINPIGIAIIAPPIIYCIGLIWRDGRRVFTVYYLL